MKYSVRLFSILLILFIAAVIVFALIIGNSNPSTSEKSYSSSAIHVVTTTGMIGDVVSQIAGAHARVTVIMGSGIDPHLYTPTRNDVNALSTADLVFFHGLHLEGAMANVLEVLQKENPTNIFALAEQLSPSSLIYSEETPDPHAWMDVSLWSQTIPIIANILSGIDPENKNNYEANASTYQETLSALDAYVHESIRTIPEAHRIVITAHDAFSYFGEAYGITVRGIQGLSTLSEASLERVNSLVNFIVERKIPSIFVESSVQDRYVRSLIEGAAAQGHTVSIGGSLFSDAMGHPETYRGTYVGMIDHNATLITQALHGIPRPGGFQDLLDEEEQ